MNNLLKNLWNKLMTTETLPILFGLLLILGVVTWLLAVFIFGVTTILNLVGVM